MRIQSFDRIDLESNDRQARQNSITGSHRRLLVFANQTRNPIRNQALVLLSVKAGLRAGEIAKLTWPMLVEPTGEVGWSMSCKTASPRKAVAVLFPFMLSCTQLW